MVFKGIYLIILVQSCGWTTFCRNALQCSTKHALRHATAAAAATTLYQANPAQTTAWLQLEGRKLRAPPWLLMIRVNRLPKLRSLGKVYRQAGRQTRKCWVAYQAIVCLTGRHLSAFYRMQVFENKREDTAMFFAEIFVNTSKNSSMTQLLLHTFAYLTGPSFRVKAKLLPNKIFLGLV